MQSYSWMRGAKIYEYRCRHNKTVFADSGTFYLVCIELAEVAFGLVEGWSLKNDKTDVGRMP